MSNEHYDAHSITLNNVILKATDASASTATALVPIRASYETTHMIHHPAYSVDGGAYFSAVKRVQLRQTISRATAQERMGMRSVLEALAMVRREWCQRNASVLGGRHF